MKGTWQTDSGGSGSTGGGLLILAAAVVIAAVAVPVIHALTALLEVVLVGVFSVAGLGIAGGIGYAAWRRQHPAALPLWRVDPDAAAAEAIRTRQQAQLPAGAQRQGLPPSQVHNHQHLHLHGLSPEQVAEIIRDTRSNGGTDAR
jgi:hypothetical protein